MEETSVVEKILRSLLKKSHYGLVIIKELPKNGFFLTIQGLVGKLQAHEEKINKVQEDMGSRALFSKLSIKEKQDESRYNQGGRGHGQGRGRDRLEREG